MRSLSTFLATLLLAVAFLLAKSPVAMAQPNFLSSSIFTTEVTHLALFSFAGTRPDFLGVKDGKLAPCPNSPNCVSSQATDPEHSITAIAYKSSPEDAIAQLKQVIQAQENAKIVTEGADYLYVEFTSKLMGFVDDVEFYLDKSKSTIEVRSASRLGQSDLGVNRQRIETVRAKLQELDTKA